MRSSNIPPLRVTPKLRQDGQSPLKEGETLSSFVEEALREQIENHKFHQKFIARGLASRDKAKATGNFVSKEVVMDSLEQLLRRVTSENIHDTIETGEAIGQEIW